MFYNIPTRILHESRGDKDLLDLLCFSVLIKGRYGSGVLCKPSVRKVMELMGVGAKRATRIIENSKTSDWFKWSKGNVIAKRLVNKNYRTIKVEKKHGDVYHRIVDDNVCVVAVDEKTTRKSLIGQFRKLLAYRAIRGKIESFKRLLCTKGVNPIAITQEELSDAIGVSRSTARRVLGIMEEEGLIKIERWGIEEMTEHELTAYLYLYPNSFWFRLNESFFVMKINRYGIQDKEFGHRVTHVIFNHDKRMTKCIKKGEVSSIAYKLSCYEDM